MNQNTFELAPSQIPEWYAYQLDAQSPVYNISFNHYFFDGLEPSLFVRTWQLLLDRHSVFRITFAYAEGGPVQKLNPPIVLNAQEVIIDKTYLKDEDVFGWQNKLAKEFGEQVFDFEKGPLFRLHLVLYPQQQSQLIFTVHHIIWDETSTINLIKEFTQIYTALLEGEEPSLPVLDDDYFGYVNKVHKDMKSGLWDKHKAYWLNHYSHAPTPLVLPLDYSRPACQTYNGDTKELWLPRELIHAVSPFLIATNSTLFIFYMAALAVYFYKMSGQTDFVLGSPMAGRESIEHKNILGCFAHPLPIRCVVNPEDTFLVSFRYRRVITRLHSVIDRTLVHQQTA